MILEGEKEMLKKNQLVLILLTLVLMLSVYFIRAPFSQNDNGDNSNGNLNYLFHQDKSIILQILTMKQQY